MIQPKFQSTKIISQTDDDKIDKEDKPEWALNINKFNNEIEKIARGRYRLGGAYAVLYFWGSRFL